MFPPGVVIAFLEKIVKPQYFSLKYDYKEETRDISFVPASIPVTLQLGLH